VYLGSAPGFAQRPREASESDLRRRHGRRRGGRRYLRHPGCRGRQGRYRRRSPRQGSLPGTRQRRSDHRRHCFQTQSLSTSPNRTAAASTCQYSLTGQSTARMSRPTLLNQCRGWACLLHHLVERLQGRFPAPKAGVQAFHLGSNHWNQNCCHLTVSPLRSRPLGCPHSARSGFRPARCLGVLVAAPGLVQVLTRRHSNLSPTKNYRHRRRGRQATAPRFPPAHLHRPAQSPRQRYRYRFLRSTVRSGSNCLRCHSYDVSPFRGGAAG
jgi:hypothetical protein